MNNKLIVGLGIAALVVVIVKMNSKQTKEDFWNNAPRTVKVIREVQPQNGAAYSLQNNYQAMLGNDKFVSTPSFQANLSPRFSNVDYGANIKYNMPSYENQAVPCDPLTMGNMARENYRKETPARQTRENYGNSMNSCGGGFSGGCGGGCGVPSCGKGGISLGTQKMTLGDTGADPNYVNSMNTVYNQFTSPAGSDLVAVGDMTTINADGTLDQPIVYDRYIYANQRSRLYGLGDPIRGDLPIMPINNGWFNVSVVPSIDLRQGAINVIAGVDNATNKSLAELQYATSGKAVTAIGGINMANMFESSAGAGATDVNISSFP